MLDLAELTAGFDLVEVDAGQGLGCGAGRDPRLRACGYGAVFHVLARPPPAFRALRNFLCAILLGRDGFLSCSLESLTITAIVPGWPVAHFLFDRRSTIAGVRVIAEELRRPAPLLVQNLKEICQFDRVVAGFVHDDR